jgi:hemerythrin-like domain-containing protein
MVHSHNCLLRGLNAILQQGPHISSYSQPGYNPQDVKDLLSYIEAWIKTIEHHHATEESTMFPAIEKLAGIPGLMSGPIHQHEAFHPGLVELQKHVIEKKEKVAEYRWEDVKGIIDGFVPSLYTHLEEEIGAVLALEQSCDSEGLKKVWLEVEAVAKANGNLGMLVRSPLLSIKHMTDCQRQSTKSSPSFWEPVIRRTKEETRSLPFQPRCRI